MFLPTVLPFIKALVIGRMVPPGNELHTYQWVQYRSVLYELAGSPLRDSLNPLYRAADHIIICKDVLENHLANRERDLFDLPERICLFD
jgi:hypothetical protein